MKILKQWWNQIIKRPVHVPVWAFIGTLLFSAIGFADALYLTIVHYKNELPPCTLQGCEKVLTSQYAEILGVPVALIGAIYYGAILVMAVLYMEEKYFMKKADDPSWYMTLALSASHIGFFATIWFVSIQYFVIDAWCQYCLISALCCVALWIIGRVYFLKNNKNTELV